MVLRRIRLCLSHVRRHAIREAGKPVREVYTPAGEMTAVSVPQGWGEVAPGLRAARELAKIKNRF